MSTHTRNIKTGKQFENVVPAPKNRKVFLGSGDTFTSLKVMRKVIFETLNETEQLAKQLAGKTIQETVDNIKEFIYWHIQYLQDETEQLIHSPAHTWSVRSTGVDCKSYSIFASSILTNLKIANSLRQIKQVAYNSEYWSHVYVVLPNDDLVIDGTVSYNSEPTYLEKFDEPILQNGLQGLGQLAAACNWCRKKTNHNNNNNNSNITKINSSEIRGGTVKKGGRLPFTHLADLLTENSQVNSTKRESDNSGDLVSNGSFRLRLAIAKAKARKRKIVLINI